MPGTTVYNQGVQTGHIRSEIDHLNWLSIEQALVQDEFLNYNGLPEPVLRKAYKRIYYPEHFLYFHPNNDDGSQESVKYAGEKWRNEYSSAGPNFYPGSDRYTLDKVGAPGMKSTGASQCNLYGDGLVDIHVAK